MAARRSRINRVLLRDVAAAVEDTDGAGADAPRKLGGTLIEFASLHLPAAVSCALAEAFWNQEGARSEQTVRAYWHHLTIFARFVAETHAVSGLSDIDTALLVRYLEWLNQQKSQKGQPWSKGTRYSTYTTLRTLLQWLRRCHPQLLGSIDFPVNPVPWKNRDVRRVSTLSSETLCAVLKACERDIEAFRTRRDNAAQAMEAAGGRSSDSISTLGALLLHIDRHYGGVVPPTRTLHGEHYRVLRALEAHGGVREIEPCLYPRADSLFPYYLAILIHTAGNPEPITELDIDCLQLIPLLDDREVLVWSKARAGTQQRRSFRTANRFEPPALVRELLQWTRRLRPHAAAGDSDRLFLYRSQVGISALSMQMGKLLLGRFTARHRLPHFTLLSIRSSVLTAFYRASGDLRQVKEIANHAHLSTTVGYVHGPEVETQNRARIATLQSAFLGHIEHPSASVDWRVDGKSEPDRPSAPPPASATGESVSMFGFSCKDLFAGIAPGTRAGELCTNFLGCFTCPNAVITADPRSLARLLQARDHLQTGSSYLHPARWEAIYAPQLRILEEDILTRFSGRELAAAAALRSALPPLPELR